MFGKQNAIEQQLTEVQIWQKEQNQSEYCDQKIVCNEDLFRITQYKLKETLHRSIGALVFLNRNKQRSVGSGTLISKDLILTAAHNIYDQRLECQYTSFKFYIGAEGEAEQYHEVESWRYPEEFKTCPQSAKMPYDYGVMKLKRPVNLGKYMQLSLPCQLCLKSKEKEKEVNIYGFPNAYGNFAPLDQKGNKIKLAQYGLTRKDRVISVDIAKFKISYGISTLPGQSGCPVSVDDTIIAVHVGGDKQQFNVGRAIDSTLIYNLKKWEVELNAAPFAIKTENLCSKIGPLNLRLVQKELIQPSGELQAIQLEKYPNLVRLDLRSNKIQSIDLSLGPHLTSIQLSSNLLKTIDTSYNAFLTHLNLQGNRLQKIDLSCNTNLSVLNLGENKISTIDLRKNVRLTELWLYSNKLKSIDLSQNTELQTLWLSQNSLSAINLATNKKLIELSLHHNNLTSIDLAENHNLTSIRLNHNLLAGIDLSKHTNLKELYLYNNNLNTIDLRNCANNQKLLLDSNKLSLIDVTISEHVPVATYANVLNFRFDHQDSLQCRIRLAYNKAAIKDKAIQICNNWRESYSAKENNSQQCKYIFQIN